MLYVYKHITILFNQLLMNIELSLKLLKHCCHQYYQHISWYTCSFTTLRGILMEGNYWVTRVSK